MRVPGIHVLLTAGVVTVLSVGTVSAVALTGSGQADPRLPQDAPPPAVAAPLVPAPLPAAPAMPAPEPAVESEPTSEPTRDAEPETDAPAPDDADEPRRQRPATPQDDDNGGGGGGDGDGDTPQRPGTVRPDPDGTSEQKLAYACQRGFFSGDICKRYR